MSVRTLVLVTEYAEAFPDESTFGDGVFVVLADIASAAGDTSLTLPAGVEPESDA